MSQTFDNGTICSSEQSVVIDAPVRDRVLRGRRRAWVPAVLRYTAAGNAVLVEVCNLSNPEDRELILQHEWREKFARAVVEGASRSRLQLELQLRITGVVLGTAGCERLAVTGQRQGVDGKEHQTVVLLQGSDNGTFVQLQSNGDRFALEALAQGSDPFVDGLWLVL